MTVIQLTVTEKQLTLECEHILDDNRVSIVLCSAS